MHIGSRFLFGVTMEKHSEIMATFGGSVKDLGNGKFGGYLITFGSPSETDLSDDWFSSKTDLGVVDGSTLPLYYQHGFDGVLKNTRIGRGLVKFDEAGLWLEAQLDMRKDYEEMIAELIKDGKLGLSSGAAGHLVEREQIGKSWHIKSWPIGEASLTPNPAEPRNGVLPLKSLLTPSDAVHDGDKENTNKELDMEKDELLEVLKTHSEETATKAAELAATKAEEAVNSALEEFKSTLPEIKAGFQVEVTKDETDNKLEGNPLEGAKFYQAVKAAASGAAPKELIALNVKTAQGMNEAVPSDGGFLLPQAEKGPMLERMYSTGEILKRIQKDPIAGNSMSIPAVDETSRATGSRQGGVRGYWLEEAGTKTKSKPKFREIDLKLKKVAALVYATDEMLEDVTFMTSWINRTAPDELRFMVEDAVYNGNGVGKPEGIMGSSALVSAVRVDASAISFADIVGMWARRWAGVSDYVWLINQDVGPQLDQLYLATGTAGIPPRFVDYDAQGIMRMKGAPVLEVEYAATLGTLGDILLTSLSQYQAIDKASGIQAASSIHVRFVNDETAFRFVYRFDGEPTWNSALTPFKGTNTQSPYVALAATT